MSKHGQFRGGSVWHGVMASDLILDPRVGSVQVFESENASRTVTLVSALLVKKGSEVCHIYNFGTQNLSVVDNQGSSVALLPPNVCGILSLFANNDSAGLWGIQRRAASQLTAPPPSRTIWFFGATPDASVFLTDDAFEYNQQTNTWVQHADVIPVVSLGDSRSAACAAVFPDMFMSGGGTNSSGSLDTYRFTSSTLTGVLRAASPRKHANSSAATLDNAYHFYGGLDHDSPAAGYGDVYKYDDSGSGTWTNMEDLGTDRYWSSFVTLSVSTGYVYGGRPTIANTLDLDTIDRVTPSTGTIVAQPPSNTTRYGHGGASIDTSTLIYPCDYHSSSNTLSNRVQAYNTVAMVWTERTPVSAISGAFSGGVVGGNYLGPKVWIVGGWGGDFSDGQRTFEMTPGTVIDTWVEKQLSPTRIRDIDSGGAALVPSP